MQSQSILKDLSRLTAADAPSLQDAGVHMLSSFAGPRCGDAGLCVPSNLLRVQSFCFQQGVGRQGVALRAVFEGLVFMHDHSGLVSHERQAWWAKCMWRGNGIVTATGRRSHRHILSYSYVMGVCNESSVVAKIAGARPSAQKTWHLQRVPTEF